MASEVIRGLLAAGLLGVGAAAGAGEDLWPEHALRVALPDREDVPFLAVGPEGRPEGLEPAVARTLAAALGLEPVLLPTAGGQAGVLAAVREGRAELGLARLTIDLGAARAVRLSRPYAAPARALLYNRLALARALPGEPPERLLLESGAAVAFLRDDLGDRYLAMAYPGARAVPFADLDRAAVTIAGGDPVVLLGDRLRLQDWLARHADVGLTLGYRDLPGTRVPLVVALPWRAERLRGAVDASLGVLEGDGTLAALRARHLGAAGDAPP